MVFPAAQRPTVNYYDCYPKKRKSDVKQSKTKRMGQHFLKNARAVKKIISSISPQGDDLIIEIGAGRGTLTFSLAKKAGKIIAIEKDRSFIPFLSSHHQSNLVILGEDVLKIDFKELIEKEKNSKINIKIVGNLPYSISTPLLFKVLEARDSWQECVFLMQKEVAERITAQPGCKQYAPLSIIFQIYFEVKIHFFLSPKVFYPPPQVDSALISLKKRDSPLYLLEDETGFLKFLKVAFRHRRKLLANNLKFLRYSPQIIEDCYQKLSLKHNLRAEELTIGQFVELFNFFQSLEITPNPP